MKRAVCSSSYEIHLWEISVGERLFAEQLFFSLDGLTSGLLSSTAATAPEHPPPPPPPRPFSLWKIHFLSSTGGGAVNLKLFTSLTSRSLKPAAVRRVQASLLSFSSLLIPGSVAHGCLSAKPFCKRRIPAVRPGPRRELSVRRSYSRKGEVDGLIRLKAVK